MPEVIASSSNPRFREIRELLGSARARRESGSSVLEGIHLVRAWRETGKAMRSLIVAESSLLLPEVSSLLPGQGVTVMKNRLFEQLGTMPSAVPVLAVVATPSPPLPVSIDGDAIVLDRIQDPGNVGAIIRSAAAAGVTRLLTTEQTAWCWSPKVLRAAMGGHFALEIHESVSWDSIESIANASSLSLAATVVRGGVSVHDADLRPRCIWLFGNEGSGIDETRLRAQDWRIGIEHSARVESLNVAAAAAICLFEQRRQRVVASSLNPDRTG